MKTYSYTLLILFFLSVSIPNISAQTGDLTKNDVLTAMNKFDGLGLSQEKENELIETNRGIVDDMFEIANTNQSEDRKIELFKDAKERNLNKLNDVLDDKTLKKYKKKVKKELKPFKRRAKFIGWIL
ncbi:hypothetical protein [Marinigracilibium pacificum]|uniref:Uncharacterized protein n=1 Tax=Marinigracilibium pacificum TaxID=2729599 RepID=A0A848IZR0_9BACT|nr:hypothetical protein [Marinigracilibium pacificum]NMM47479.1 hypothetical protein [Marinigracilibium pacificum]